MNIIGICGQKNSGKSTMARFIAELVPGTVEVALAEPLKRFCADVFGWGDDVLDGPSEMRERPDTRYPRGWSCPARGGEPAYLTPRFALQRLGTQFGRVCYEDVWVDYALREAKKWLQVDGEYRTEDAGEYGQVGARATLVVIPDVRFVNEARKIREAGGRVWRVSRARGRLLEPVQVTRGMELSATVTDDASDTDDASEREQFSAEMDKYINWDIVNGQTLALLREDVRLRLCREGNPY